MNSKFKYLSSLFFILVSGVFCWFAFKDVEYGKMKQIFKSVPIGLVILSMLFGYLAYIFRALRWLLLIEPMGFKPKPSILIHAIAFGYLFNAVIPRSGELIRCTALNKATGVPVSSLFGHVILERLIDLILLMFCVLLALVLNYQEFLSFFQSIEKRGSDIYVYIIVAMIVLTLIYKLKYLFLTENQLAKINSFFSGIKQGFISIKKMKKKSLFTIYTILIWLCYFLMTFVCLYCFDETKVLNLSHGLFILVAGAFGMVMPSQAGAGTYHICVKTALLVLPFSISQTTAIGFAHLVWSSQMIMIVVTGLCGWWVFHQYSQNKKI